MTGFMLQGHIYGQNQMQKMYVFFMQHNYDGHNNPFPRLCSCTKNNQFIIINILCVRASSGS